MVGKALTARGGNAACTRVLGLLLAVWALALATTTAPAQGQQPNALQTVEIGALPGGRVQLRFQLSGPAAEPESFTINEPARIVLDFVGVSNGLSNNQQDINQGVAERVTVLEGNDRTRAAINLSRLVPYAVAVQGNAVLLTLEGGAATTSTGSRPAVAEAVAPATARAAGGRAEIGAIDFRRGVEGQGIISVTLTDPSVTVDVRQQGEQVVADFAGTALPRELQRRLDVIDFATPVTIIDAQDRRGGARLTIDRVGESEFLAYQTDDRYTIEIKPVIEEEEPDDPTNREYTGELLSLNFQDIEVRAVLQILADFTGLNIVVSDSVQGNLTLRLQNVPWDQALDIIMRTKGLTARQNGTVIYVAPTEEVAAREKLELEADRQRSDLVPLRTEIIQINYAKVEDLEKLIEEDRAANDADSDSLLSARGKVSADVRTNSLLIKDTPAQISEIRALINELDVPVRQVMIDARVVIARDDFGRELGVRFGFSGVGYNSSSGTFGTLTGSLTGADQVIGSAVGNLTGTGQPFPTAIPDLNSRLGVDFAAGSLGAPGRLALALLGRDYLLDLELSALQAENRGETLSNPRVITTDRKEASIEQGQSIPYTVIDQETGIPTTEFEEAVLELKVTPQITPDGRIIMDLEVKKDEVAGFTESAPIINRRSVATQVLVDNGDTVVLGGVYEKITVDQVDKIPFLGDIPALGRLFRKNLKQDNKFELLIFVKPQIVQGGIATR